MIKVNTNRDIMLTAGILDLIWWDWLFTSGALLPKPITPVQSWEKHQQIQAKVIYNIPD